MLQSQSHYMQTQQHSMGRATNSAQYCDDGIVAITAAALPRWTFIYLFITVQKSKRLWCTGVIIMVVQISTKLI